MMMFLLRAGGTSLTEEIERVTVRIVFCIVRMSEDAGVLIVRISVARVVLVMRAGLVRRKLAGLRICLDLLHVVHFWTVLCAKARFLPVLGLENERRLLQQLGLGGRLLDVPG